MVKYSLRRFYFFSQNSIKIDEQTGTKRMNRGIFKPFFYPECPGFRSLFKHQIVQAKAGSLVPV